MNINKILAFIGLAFIYSTAQAALNPPTLSSPVNNITIKHFQTVLRVSQYTGAIKYEFQIDTTVNFNSFRLRTLSSQVNNVPYVTTHLLVMNNNYYWRVRVFSATDSSAWTNYRRIATHYKMDNLSPVNASTGSITPLKATPWHIDSAVRYVFKVDTSATFNSSNLFYRSTFSNDFLDTAYFKFGRKIYWQSTAIDADGDTLQWSGTYSYTFFSAPVTSSTSANGASVILNWGNCLSADVVLQLDVSANFNTIDLIEKRLKPGIVKDTNFNLLFGKTYFFRIKAVFDTQESAWSASRSFSTVGGLINLTPANKSNGIILLPVFSWTNINEASFEIQIFRDTFYTDLIADTFLPRKTISCVFNDTLNFSTRYFWRIRAMHAKDTSVWQNLYFDTYLGQVSQTAPANAVKNLDIAVGFQFYDYKWVDRYVLEIDTGKVFGLLPSSYRLTKTVFYDLSSTIKAFDTVLQYGRTYCWRVFAIKDGDTSDFAVTRYFTCKKTPVLIFPNNNYVGIGTYTNALILPIKGSQNVIWQLDTNLNFNSPHMLSGKDSHFLDPFFTTNVSLNFPKDLRFETTYYWRVKCIYAQDSSAWSLPFKFITTQRPWINTPANKSVNVPVAVALIWGVQGSSTDYIYQYQWSTDSNFTGVPIIALPNESSAEANVSNAYNTTYYWRGRALHSKDTSLWSPTASYTSVAAPVIAKVLLYSPINNSINVPISGVNLMWNTVSNATEYEIQVSDDMNFFTILSSGTTANFAVTFTGMQYKKTYYWRVRGKFNNVSGPWSSVWNFRTVVDVTSLNEPDSNGSSLNVYPNPSNGYAILSWNNTGFGETVITVFDLEGKQVMTEKIASIEGLQKQELNTSQLKPGVYIISLSANNQIQRIKLLVQ